MTTNRVKLLWEFVKEYNWKRIDYDNAFWYQCVDLMRKRLDKIWYVQPKKLGNNWVIKIAKNPKAYLATPDDWIPNTPKWVPAPGDVVIFNKPSDTWHVAVVISATIKTITVFEQNAGRWSKTGTGSDACRIIDVDYKNVMGWINTQPRLEVKEYQNLIDDGIFNGVIDKLDERMLVIVSRVYTALSSKK